MSFALLQQKLFEYDQRFSSVDGKLLEHDQRFVTIDQKLLEHDQRFSGIDNKLDSVMNSLDGMTGILLRLDQERIFTGEWIRRIEQDVEVLKKRAGHKSNLPD